MSTITTLKAQITQLLKQEAQDTTTIKGLNSQIISLNAKITDLMNQIAKLKKNNTTVEQIQTDLGQQLALMTSKYSVNQQAVNTLSDNVMNVTNQ